MFLIHVRLNDLWILPFLLSVSYFFFQIIGTKLSSFSYKGSENMFFPTFQDSSFAVYA